MKSALLSSLVAISLVLHAYAYVDAEDGAFNVRHIHMVERGVNGEIVGRAFGNTYDIVKRDEGDLGGQITFYRWLKFAESQTEARGRCTTVLACGTAGGCATMAGQRYCKGESWNKSFQKAVSQTGANGITGLKMMAEGIGRGPVGMIANMAKSTAKAVIKANKEIKANKKAHAKDNHKSSKKSNKQKSNSKKSPSKKGSSSKKTSSKKSSGGKKSAVSKKGSSGKKSSASKKSSSSKKSATSKKASSGKKSAAPKKAASSKKAAAPKKASTKKSAAPKQATASKKTAAPKKAAAPKSQKKKRDLEDEEMILNRRDFEVVERDEDMNFIQRSDYSIFDLVTRKEDGSLVSRECEMYNGDVSCM
ncbi:hypothetical protein NMY22_g346 [Coprinellus aureogranulatus]|nr:hypothetical protein NMY22_g346 [Coprinellus aureogranulatus]